MCGIFGVIGKRSSEVERALTLGTCALAHRGPDDEGMQILPLGSDPARCVGLGSRRLAILDLSPAGHQPMYDPKKGDWLVFNGEIFNFREIRAELERLGHVFCSNGDTEVLLKAYGQWEGACLERLRGMFAFAVWEAGKQKLFLARDRLGVKPLYYYSSADSFVFGSEVRALLASGLVPRRLDHVGLASYLASGSVQDPNTIVDGIRSLPAGNMLVWHKNKSQEQTYWSLAEVASRQPATDSAEVAADDIRQILLEAVSLRLISDVPLGVFLSGGVDSSAVVALATEVSSNPVETFSIVFAEREYTEADHSDRVAQTFGTRHHKILLDQKHLLKVLPEALASIDQPSVDGINTYVVSQAVKQAGITVALSGLGGDEVFAGYSTFRSVPRMMRFCQYIQWTRPLWQALGACVEPLQTSTLAKLLWLVGNSSTASHPYFLSRTLFLPRNIRALLGQGAPQDGEKVASTSEAEFIEGIRALDPTNQVSVLEGTKYMANTLLRDTDVMSMAHSLEVRVPFLDHKLWEYIVPLRGQLKLDSGLPKPLLLKAVGPRLPQEIYLRRKMGFTLPFERWLRGELRPAVERELLDGCNGQCWPFEAHAASAIWDAFLRGKTTWSRPWAIFVLKQWIRRNVWESL